MVVVGYHLRNDVLHLLLSYVLSCFCFREERPKCFLKVVGVSFKDLIGCVYGVVVDGLATSVEVVLHKSQVLILGYGLQHHHVCTVVEGARRVEEHLVHDMSFAAREDEVGIAAVLDVRAQQSLDVLLCIVDNLLKLVNGNDTPLVGLFNTGKNLL